MKQEYGRLDFLKQHLSGRVCASQPELSIVVEDESSRLLLRWKELHPIFWSVSPTSNLELLHCQQKLEVFSATTVVGRDASIVVAVFEEL